MFHSAAHILSPRNHHFPSAHSSSSPYFRYSADSAMPGGTAATTTTTTTTMMTTTTATASSSPSSNVATTTPTTTATASTGAQSVSFNPSSDGLLQVGGGEEASSPTRDELSGPFSASNLSILDDDYSNHSLEQFQGYEDEILSVDGSINIHQRLNDESTSGLDDATMDSVMFGATMDDSSLSYLASTDGTLNFTSAYNTWQQQQQHQEVHQQQHHHHHHQEQQKQQQEQHLLSQHLEITQHTDLLYQQQQQQQSQQSQPLVIPELILPRRRQQQQQHHLPVAIRRPQQQKKQEETLTNTLASIVGTSISGPQLDVLLTELGGEHLNQQQQQISATCVGAYGPMTTLMLNGSTSSELGISTQTAPLSDCVVDGKKKREKRKSKSKRKVQQEQIQTSDAPDENTDTITLSSDRNGSNDRIEKQKKMKLVKKKKSKNAKGRKSNGSNNVCFVCGVTESPMWRKGGEDGNKIMCNRCGLFWKRHQGYRPLCVKKGKRSHLYEFNFKQRPEKKVSKVENVDPVVSDNHVEHDASSSLITHGDAQQC